MIVVPNSLKRGSDSARRMQLPRPSDETAKTQLLILQNARKANEDRLKERKDNKPSS